MAFAIKQTSMMVAALGIASFVLGVIAENKKPASGVALPGKGFVVCKYPKDTTVALGYLSAAFLLASTAAGYFSLVYPYKGKSIPNQKLFQSTTFLVFFNIALFTAGLGLVMLLWPTITEHLHITKNVHHNLETTCPTAKTGLLGGGAFLSLDASLLWLVALMLTDNAREDYFDETEKDNKGDYGLVHSNDYNAVGHKA